MGAFNVLSSAKVGGKGHLPLACLSPPMSKVSQTLEKTPDKDVAFHSSGCFTCC